MAIRDIQPASDYIPLAEAARRLGLEPESLRKAVWRGRIAACRIGRCLFFRLAALDKYDRERQQTPETPG